MFKFKYRACLFDLGFQAIQYQSFSNRQCLEKSSLQKYFRDTSMRDHLKVCRSWSLSLV